MPLRLKQTPFFENNPDWKAQMERIAHQVGLPAAWFGDLEGYDIYLWNGAIHQDSGWVAWVESRSKWGKRTDRDQAWLFQTNTLKVQIDGIARDLWSLKTYNPIELEDVQYIGWHEEQVILLYRDGHEIIAALVPLNGEPQVIVIGKSGYEYTVFEGVIYVEESFRGHLARYRLPDLQPLPSLTPEEGLSLGLIENVNYER